MSATRFSPMIAAAALAAAVTFSHAQIVQTPPPAMPHAHIYPDTSEARKDIDAALAEARRTHKRVIVDFGGDWCGDCQVLNYYMHQPPNAEILAKNYVLVDVNVGHIDTNLDIAEKYGVPLKKGVPAMAILRGDGTVVYAQKEGEFEDFRHMQGSDLTTLLEMWKPR